MIDGYLIEYIECKNVKYFSYQNIFEDDEGFACYVGDVRLYRLSKMELQNKLQARKFWTDTFFEHSKTEYFKITLESGEIFLKYTVTHMFRGLLITMKVKQNKVVYRS